MKKIKLLVFALITFLSFCVTSVNAETTCS